MEPWAQGQEHSSPYRFSIQTGQNIYFYTIILYVLHLYIFPFCVLSWATINLIIPATKMRQNLNSTVTTALHQSVSWHTAPAWASSLSPKQLTALPTLLLQPYTQSATCAVDRKSTLITLMENYLFTTVEGCLEGTTYPSKHWWFNSLCIRVMSWQWQFSVFFPTASSTWKYSSHNVLDFDVN